MRQIAENKNNTPRKNLITALFLLRVREQGLERSGDLPVFFL